MFDKISLVIISFFLTTFNTNAYNLFNAVPSERMRGLSTDRPDKTESPYSVPAGHFQIETDFIVHSIDKSVISGQEYKATSTTLNNLNFKLGISDNSDLQFVIPTFTTQKTTLNGRVGLKANGVGDLTLRYKYNFFGNDEGNFSFGTLVYVKFATGDDELTNNKFESGIMFPFAIVLPNNWSMGTMFQIDNKYDGATDGRRTDYIITWTLGHPIYGDLSGFFELFSQYSDRSNQEPVATFDLGLTYLVTDKIQLDLGGFFGMTDAADDAAYFFGISILI